MERQTRGLTSESARQLQLNVNETPFRMHELPNSHKPFTIKNRTFKHGNAKEATRPTEICDALAIQSMN